MKKERKQGNYCKTKLLDKDLFFSVFFLSFINLYFKGKTYWRILEKCSIVKIKKKEC